MKGRKPLHPGEFIRLWYLERYGMSSRYLAEALGVERSTLPRVLAGEAAVSPDLALRLAKALGHSPEQWLWLQCASDLWEAAMRIDERIF